MRRKTNCNGGNRRRYLFCETLEHRVMLTTTDFAFFGDHGQSENTNEIAWLINRESDPGFPEFSVASLQSHAQVYEPSIEDQQDFILSAGDARFPNTHTLATSHSSFCHYLKGVETTDCAQSFSGLFPVSPGDPSTGKSQAANRFFAAPGNHEHAYTGVTDFTNYFDLPGAGVTSPNPTGSELYYDVLQDDVHVFVVDSSPFAQPGIVQEQFLLDSIEAQEHWLREGLRWSQAKWQVVLMHHPAYASGHSHPEVQFDYTEWGVTPDLVLAGDHHFYERVEQSGVTYVLNGTGGFPNGSSLPLVDGSITVDDSSTPGVVFFSASDTELHGEFKVYDGLSVENGIQISTRDDFTIQVKDRDLPCDIDGDGDGCDIEDLDELYARMEREGFDGNQKAESITQWLASASSPENPAKQNSSDVYVRGDVNLDGKVDSDDLGLLLNNFNTNLSVGWGGGDFDAADDDDEVNSEDLGQLLNNWTP